MLFAATELRVKEPMLPLGHFRNKAFSGAQVAAFAISASFFAIFVYTTLYLQEILHLSAVEAGPSTSRRRSRCSSSPASAHSSRRCRRGALIAVGLALVAVGMAL